MRIETITCSFQISIFLQILLNQKGLANNKQKTQYEYLHGNNIEG